MARSNCHLCKGTAIGRTHLTVNEPLATSLSLQWESLCRGRHDALDELVITPVISLPTSVFVARHLEGDLGAHLVWRYSDWRCGRPRNAAAMR